jgi:hypothetical protein
LLLEALSSALEVEDLVPVVLAGPGVAVGGLLALVFHESPAKKLLISDPVFFVFLIRQNYFSGIPLMR